MNENENENDDQTQDEAKTASTSTEDEAERSIEELLGSLSDKDRVLVERMKAYLTQDIDRQIELMRMVGQNQIELMFIKDSAERACKFMKDSRSYYWIRMELLWRRISGLMVALFCVIIAGTLLLAFAPLYLEGDSHLRRKVLAVRAHIAEADQLWCRYDLSEAIHAKDTDHEAAKSPSFPRPDAGRAGPRPPYAHITPKEEP